MHSACLRAGLQRARSTLKLWVLGQAQGSQAVHVLDYGRASRSFLLHRKCNLGFSPLNTRCDTFFWLALYWFRLFCFVHDRQAVYAIPCLIDGYSEPGLRTAVPLRAKAEQ